MFKNIVFVCTGNICRSPMAEYLFKQQMNHQTNTFDISSAGTHALSNHPISTHSATLLNKEHINCSQHISRQLTKEIISQSDLVLVMETFHKYTINSIAAESQGKVFLLGHWDQIEISDPYNKNLTFYKHTMQLIRKGLGSWGKKLKELSARA
jgi:protein-tyrosine phosphatase